MAPPTAPPQSLFTPAYLRILLVQMAFGFSYSAFLLLPKYLRVELDASATEIGWMNGVALVGAALLAPFVGLSAKFIRRKTLLSLALVAEGVAAIAFAVSDGMGPGTYLLRLLQGLAWVTLFNCTATMVADAVPRERLARAFGYLGVSMLATNALAPVVTEPLAANYGWGVAFGAPGIIALCAVALVSGLPESESQGARQAGQGVATPAALACYYGSLLMGAGIGVMFTFTQPFALSLGMHRVGSFFLGYTAAAVFVRVGLASLADRVGPAKVAVLSLFGYSLVVLATSRLTPDLLVPLGTLLGVCHGLFYPAITATGIAHLTTQERPVFMGWFSCAFNAGYAVTVLSLGPVADRFGYPVIFVTVGIVITTGVVPLAITQRSERPATGAVR